MYNVYNRGNMCMVINVHVVQYRIYIFDDKCATCTTEVICVW